MVGAMLNHAAGMPWMGARCMFKAGAISFVTMTAPVAAQSAARVAGPSLARMAAMTTLVHAEVSGRASRGSRALYVL